MSNALVSKNNNFIESTRANGFSILRTLLVSPVAFLATGGLIWGMERLIFTEPLAVKEIPPYVVPSPILGEQKQQVTRRDPPVKPDEPEMEPEVPNLKEFTIDESTGGELIFDDDLVTPKTTLQTFSADVPIATMLSQPDYPVRAARNGIEGYVDVTFDVAPSGAAENVTVTSAVPERIFDRAAVNAVKRWKFQPAEKNGKPVRFEGMTHRIVFQMAQPTG